MLDARCCQPRSRVLFPRTEVQGAGAWEEAHSPEVDEGPWRGEVLVVDAEPVLLAGEEVGGVDGPGRGAVHHVHRVRDAQVVQRHEHGARDDPPHAAALHHHTQAEVVVPCPWLAAAAKALAYEVESGVQRLLVLIWVLQLVMI